MDELDNALANFVAASWPYPLGPLQLFCARSGNSRCLGRLPPISFEAFDQFREQLNEREYGRLGNPFDNIETTYWRALSPYVFARFRFHMPLTDELSPMAQSRGRGRG
ncbi:DUF1045 domain-containing protein [Bradyrhizobium sp. UFLA05-153]